MGKFREAFQESGARFVAGSELGSFQLLDAIRYFYCRQSVYSDVEAGRHP